MPHSNTGSYEPVMAQIICLLIIHPVVLFSEGRGEERTLSAISLWYSIIIIKE